MSNKFEFFGSLPISDVFLWKKDTYSRYLDCNESCSQQLFGFKHRLDAVGQTDYTLPCPLADSAPDFITQDKKILTTGVAIKFIKAYRCAYNELKILLTIKTPLFDHTRSIIGTQGYCMDITQPWYAFNQSLSTDFSQSQNVNDFNLLSLPLNPKPALSKRQAECLALLISGYSSKQTAKLLSLSPRTIEHYIETLKIKFNCQSKAELIVAALAQGFAHELPKKLIKRLT